MMAQNVDRSSSKLKCIVHVPNNRRLWKNTNFSVIVITNADDSWTFVIQMKMYCVNDLYESCKYNRTVVRTPSNTDRQNCQMNCNLQPYRNSIDNLFIVDRYKYCGDHAEHGSLSISRNRTSLITYTLHSWSNYRRQQQFLRQILHK